MRLTGGTDADSFCPQCTASRIPRRIGHALVSCRSLVFRARVHRYPQEEPEESETFSVANSEHSNRTDARSCVHTALHRSTRSIK